MKKKVLIFSLMYYPRVGGAEVAIKEITDSTGDNFEFHMITVGGDMTLPETETIGNVVVHRIGLFNKNSPTHRDLVSFPLYLNKVLFPFLAFFKSLKLHKKYTFDLVWSVLMYGGFPSVFFKWKYPYVPYLLTLQDGDTPEYLTRRIRLRVISPIVKQIFKKADHLQAISHYLSDFGIQMGFRGIPRVIPNGVDYELFKKEISFETINQFKKEHNIQVDDKVLIHTGRLVEKNGVADIIMALSKLSPHIKLLLVGDGPLKNNLMELAHKEGVEKRIIFVGFKQYDKLPNYYAVSDIFIRPSLSEGFGNVFVEAMTAGVPVIGTSVGGIKDFLEDGKTGWVCKPNDPESIVRKVHYVLNPANREVVEGVLLNAQKMVQDKYQWKDIARQMSDLFNETINYARSK